MMKDDEQYNLPDLSKLDDDEMLDLEERVRRERRRRGSVTDEHELRRLSEEHNVNLDDLLDVRALGSEWSTDSGTAQVFPMQHLGYYVRKGEVAMVALKTTYEEPVSADAHEEHRERAREEILAILEQIQEDIRDEN